MAATLSLQLKDETAQGLEALKKRIHDSAEGAKQFKTEADNLRIALDLTPILESQAAYNAELARTSEIMQRVAQDQARATQAAVQPQQSIGGQQGGGEDGVLAHTAKTAVDAGAKIAVTHLALRSFATYLGTTAATLTGWGLAIAAVSAAVYGAKKAFDSFTDSGEEATDRVTGKLDKLRDAGSLVAEVVGEKVKSALQGSIDEWNRWGIAAHNAIDPVAKDLKGFASLVDTAVGKMLSPEKARSEVFDPRIASRVEKFRKVDEARAYEADGDKARMQRMFDVESGLTAADAKRRNKDPYEGLSLEDVARLISNEETELRKRASASRNDPETGAEKARRETAELEMRKESAARYQAGEGEKRAIDFEEISEAEKEAKKKAIDEVVSADIKAIHERLDAEKRRIREAKELGETELKERLERIEKHKDHYEKMEKDITDTARKAAEERARDQEKATEELFAEIDRANEAFIRKREAREREAAEKERQWQAAGRDFRAAEHDTLTKQIAGSGIVAGLRATTDPKAIAKQHVDRMGNIAAFGFKGTPEEEAQAVQAARRRAAADVRRGRVGAADWEAAAELAMGNRAGHVRGAQGDALRAAIASNSGQLQQQATMDAQLADVQAALLMLQQQASGLNAQSNARGQNFRQQFQRRGVR